VVDAIITTIKEFGVSGMHGCIKELHHEHCVIPKMKDDSAEGTSMGASITVSWMWNELPDGMHTTHIQIGMVSPLRDCDAIKCRQGYFSSN
jgi:hypothetical protein